jgi:hypothetical protein
MRLSLVPVAILLLFAFTLLPQPNLSQQATQAPSPFVPPAPQPPVRDPQALAILEASIKAMGGTPPSDSTATGTVTQAAGQQSQEGTILVQTRGTDQSLEEITLPNSTTTTVYSRLIAAQTTNSNSQAALTGQVAVVSQTSFFPLPLLAAAVNNPDFSLQYIGLESVNGTSAEHIRIWNTFNSRPQGTGLVTPSTRDIWINPASNLPEKIAYSQQTSNPQVPPILVEVDLANYANSNGFAYPRGIAKSLNGTPWLTISIQSVAFNTGLSDSTFPVICN